MWIKRHPKIGNINTIPDDMPVHAQINNNIWKDDPFCNSFEF